MNQRQEQLLKLVVENHIDRAEPVGSKLLANSDDLEVSGATIRNEMRDLEEQGFLTHPHTSAGRIPTETGYKYYVEHIMKPLPLRKRARDNLLALVKTERDASSQLKKAGRFVAEWTNNAVIIAFDKDNIYYTGISHLFSQPEFEDYTRLVKFSSIFDHCEERIDYLFSLLKDNRIKILVGGQNPLGAACSLVGARMKGNSLFAMLGPMRMNYARNVGVVEFVGELFHC